MPKAAQVQLSKAMAQSGREIWLAGVGAFATARHEGSKLFDLFVQEGRRAIGGNGLNKLGARARGTVGQLERAFEVRVEKALKGMGVPTSREIHDLARRVEKLDAHVSALVRRRGQAGKRASR